MINGKSAMKKKLFYSKEYPNQVFFGHLTKSLACAMCMDQISTAESLIKLLLLVLLSKQVTGLLLTVFSLVWSPVHTGLWIMLWTRSLKHSIGGETPPGPEVLLAATQAPHFWCGTGFCVHLYVHLFTPLLLSITFY